MHVAYEALREHIVSLEACEDITMKELIERLQRSKNIDWKTLRRMEQEGNPDFHYNHWRKALITRLLHTPTLPTWRGPPLPRLSRPKADRPDGPRPGAGGTYPR